MAEDIIIGRTSSDLKKFGNQGLIYLGKLYVKMGQISSLSNRVLLDVARTHVILVAGKRGSGKSYTLGVIAEEISNLPAEIAKNLAVLIFDTMGIFWTMKHRNEKDVDLLKQWQLKPEPLAVRVWIPAGKVNEYRQRGIEFDYAFSISPSLIDVDDWLLTFNLSFQDPIGITIEKAVNKLKEKMQKGEINNYDLDDIIETIKTDKEATLQEKRGAIALFEGAKTWGIFASKNEKGTNIEDLIKPGTSILDLSCYPAIGTFNIRALVIGLLCKHIFEQRVLARKKEELIDLRHGLGMTGEKREMPLVWILIDEGHEFLPRSGKTAATDALVQLLREGRQPGISLVLATQQPGKIHTDVMTQSDIVISHRVTSRHDIEALNEIMQSYMAETIQQKLDELPREKGTAIILDDVAEKIYSIRVRPRFTWHGGESPVAVKKKEV